MKLFCFGFGYTARALAPKLVERGFAIAATARTPEIQRQLAEEGIETVPFDGTEPLPARALDGVTHILVSIPPDDLGCPVARHCGAQVYSTLAMQWVGYLSTTGVYGDRRGGVVDETTEPRPVSDRGENRLRAERQWLAHRLTAVPSVQVFRLAGIYGPGRSQFNALRAGTAKRIVKPGQIFSRIHVDDLTDVLLASIARPHPGGIYNVCDDLAAPPQDVVVHAAKLLGMEPPPETPFEDAELSPMARSFYAESKRVANDRIKNELHVRLNYPTYREGLAAVLAAENGDG